MLYDPNWAVPATEIKLEPWQEILLHAVNLLERHGWVQHNYGSTYMGFCTIGAVETAGWALYRSYRRHLADGARMERPPSSAAAESRTASALGKVRKAIQSDDIAGWNDHPCRDKYEVINLLRKVATDAI